MINKVQQKLVDKEWVTKNIVSFENNFLKKKYNTKAEAEIEKKKLALLFGDDYLNLDVNLPTDEPQINTILKEKAFSKKYFIDSLTEFAELNPNHVDFNGLYFVYDSNSIDEDNKYYIFSVVNEEDNKAWALLSCPSYAFEEEDIDFEKEITRLDSYVSNPISFLGWDEMKAYMEKQPTKYMKIFTAQGECHAMRFYCNNFKYSYKTVDCYYFPVQTKLFEKDNGQVTEIYDKDEYARTLINPKGVEDENQE